MRNIGKMHFDYNERVRSLDDDDFFAQVKRTVGGQRISEEQFHIILNDIELALQFEEHDNLLDLCCGNAHLASHFFNKISFYMGVDSSKVLLDVAKKYFLTEKTHYIESDLIEFLANYSNVSSINKILFYGSMQYFSPSMLNEALYHIKQRFVNVEKILISPIPDRDKAEKFFEGAHGVKQNIDDYETSIGRFYSLSEIEKLARDNGFNCNYVSLNKNASNAYYRYSVLLT